jgi:recombination protein RecR
MAHPDPIKKIIDYFMRLPGIGPRQASRFAYNLLDEDTESIRGFSSALLELADSAGRCDECARSIDKGAGAIDTAKLCVTCSGPIKSILVIEKDQDLETISKSGEWRDSYHVLGGTVSLLNEKTRVTERIKSLYERLGKRTKDGHVEVVLATSATTEGDATALYIERVLEPYTKNNSATVTKLGRGISTGTEMEFADTDTLKNAIQNRK